MRLKDRSTPLSSCRKQVVSLAIVVEMCSTHLLEAAMHVDEDWQESQRICADSDTSRIIEDLALRISREGAHRELLQDVGNGPLPTSAQFSPHILAIDSRGAGKVSIREACFVRIEIDESAATPLVLESIKEAVVNIRTVLSSYSGCTDFCRYASTFFRVSWTSA